MPVAAAVAVRYLIMAIIQLGLAWLLEKYALPLLNKGVESIMETFGVDEATAKDIMANQVIQTAERVGIFALVMRSKMPIKVAEYLGFTTKGFGLRKLAPAVESKIAGAGISKTLAKAATTAEVETIAKEVSVSKGLSFAKVNDVVSLFLKIALAPVGVLYMIAQYIDYGNWNSGAYQGTFQKILGVFGLHPDAQMPSSKVLSTDTWNKVFNTYKEQGATGINDPFKNQTVLFTRDNLIDLVDKSSAAILLDGGSTSVKNVIAVTQALIIFQTPVSSTQSGGGSSSTSSTVAGGSLAGATTSAVKVFTGVLSSGTIGNGLTFTPRQDDLIENMAELQQAISNNVSPYLAALLSNITYEIKVASSVIVKGVRVTGTTQTIQTGNTKAGKAIMKTVVNKFAVVDLYLVKEDGGRSKLKSIILGPTNAINFQPTTADLAGLANTIPQNITTSNTDDINFVASNTPTINTTPVASQPVTSTTPATNANSLPSQKFSAVGGTFELYSKDGVDTYLYAVKQGYMGPIGGFWPTIPLRGVNFDITDPVQLSAFKVMLTSKPVETPAPAPVASVASTTAPTATYLVRTDNLPITALQANTLSEFYSAQGKALPSITERGQLYQNLGLGQSAYYTGTAEQNTKLLQKLKYG